MLLVALLAGCTFLTWHDSGRGPMRTVRVHYVGDVQGICTKLNAAIDIYGGCAWWNTLYSTCDIFLWDMTGWLFEPHERRHCAGEDHL